ncbi:MAG: class I SAM-dependent methyltransferase [Dehalococcoidales bacterium]|nr:class I SAM-dependent methyltransferase [Dehalococcoidales bacterium]
MSHFPRYDHEILAWEYDRRQPSPFPGEVAWYLKYAAKTSPILEFACGSGRLTIPFAEAGYHVHAIDLSQTMLHRLHSRLASLDTPTGNRITTFYADMTTFSHLPQYPLVVLPYNSIQYLETKDAISKFFNHVFSLLGNNGRFLFVVRRWHTNDFTNGKRIIDWMKQPLVNAETGVTVGSKLTFTPDEKNGQVVNEREYLITYPDGEIQHIKQTSRAPLIEVATYLEMLEAVGFNAIAYSGYTELPDDGKSREICFVCRHIR